MAGIFQEVGLKWGEKEYTVPADQVMGLIAEIEEVLTFEDLLTAAPKRAKLAKGYASAMRYAGAKVTDDEVYASFFGKGSIVATAQVVNTLLTMMIPPEHLQTKQPENSTQTKKPRATRSRKSATGSSRKRT